MPHFKMPSFGSSASPEKLPKDAVDAGSAKVDITLPKADLEIKGPKVQVSEDQEASMLSKPEQVLTVTMPSVEVEERDVDIKLPGETLEEKGKESKFKLPKIPDFDIAFPKIKSSDLKSAVRESDTETKLPEAEIKVKGLDGEPEILSSEDTELKMEKGKFKMPELHMPKFAISLSKGSSKQGKEDESTSKLDITSTKVELDVKKPDISTEGKAEGKVTSPEFSILRTKPSGYLATGEPSIKVTRPEGDIKVDREQVLKAEMLDVDVSLSTTKENQIAMTLKETDITLTKPKVKPAAIQGDTEQEIVEDKEKDGKKITFKMPQVKMPMFGVSVSAEKVPKEEIHVGEIKPEVSLPAVAVDVKGPQVTTVTTGLDVSGGRPEIDLASQNISVTAPQIDVQLPSITTRLQSKEVQLKEPEQPELVESVPGIKTFDVTVPGVETDIHLPKIEKTKRETREEIEASSKEDTEKEKKKVKFKTPHFKMPLFGSSASPEKLPKDAVDAGLAKVDITLPEADLEIKGPKVQMSEDQEASTLSKPEHVLTVTMPSVEVEERDVDIKLPGETLEEKGKESKFKLPKIPDFDIAFPKIKSSDVKSAVHESDTETKLTEAEIKVKGLDGEPEILSSEDAELKMEKGKFKMPEIHMPKFGISFSKGSSKQDKGDESTSKIVITSPKVELDVTKPHISTEGKAEVNVTAPEISISTTKPSGDLVTGELSIKVPRPEGDIKVDREQVLEAEMPDVDVSVSTTKEKQIAVTLKETDITLTKPKVKTGAIQGDTEQEIKEDKEKDGKQIKFKMPHVKMPIFRMSVSAEKVPRQEMHVGEIRPEVSIAAVAVDVKVPQVTTVTTGLDVSGARPEIDLATQNISVAAPQIDVLIPSTKSSLQSREVQLKEPVQPELRESIPGMKRFDVTIPVVETDIHLPKIEKTKKETGEAIEASSKEDTEKEKKTGKFKMPHFKMPSFGSSASPEKLPKDIVAAGSAKVDITLPKADLEIKGPKVQMNEDQEALMLSKPEQELTVTMPSVEVEERDVDIKLSGETLEEKGKESKIPDFDIAFPKIKGLDVKSALHKPGTETNLPDVEFEHTVLLGKPENLSSEDAESKMEKGKFKMPEMHIQRFGISFSKGSSKQGKGDESTYKLDITSPKVELDVKKPQISTESKTEVKVTASEFSIPTTKPSGDLAIGEFGIKVSRPEVGIKLDREKVVEAEMPDVDVSLPTTKEKGIAMTLKETDTLTKPKLSEVREGSTDGKHSKFKMPHFKMPRFGISSSANKALTSETDIESPKVDMSLLSRDDGIKEELPSPHIDVNISQVKSEAIDVKVGSKEFVSVSQVKPSSMDASTMELCDIKSESDTKENAGTVEGNLPIYTKAIELESDKDVVKSKVMSSEEAAESKQSKEKKSDTKPKKSKINLPSLGNLLKGFDLEFHFPILESDDLKPKDQDKPEDTIGRGEGNVDGNVESIASLSTAQTLAEATVKHKGVERGEYKDNAFDNKIQSESTSATASSESKPAEVNVSDPQSDTDVQNEIAKDKSGMFKIRLPWFGDNTEDSIKHENKSIDSKEKHLQYEEKKESEISSAKGGWFKFPKLNISSPSKDLKDVNNENASVLTEEIKAEHDIIEENVSDIAEISHDAGLSEITDSHLTDMPFDSPTRVTVKYTHSDVVTGTSDVFAPSDIVTSTARTELILLEPSIPEKFRINTSNLLHGDPSMPTKEITDKIGKGDTSVLQESSKVQPEMMVDKPSAIHSTVFSEHTLPTEKVTLKVSSSPATSSDDTTHGGLTVTHKGSVSVKKYIVKETFSDEKENVVITQKMKQNDEDSEIRDTEEAVSALQRLKDTMHSEKIKFFQTPDLSTPAVSSQSAETELPENK
ncbi:AHNK protein, partial [Polypterus senegalus]